MMSQLRTLVSGVRNGELSRMARLVALRVANVRPRYFYPLGMNMRPTTVLELREAYIRSQEHWLAGPRPYISALISSNRPHRIGPTLHMLASQRGCTLDIIIATHGFHPTHDDRTLATRLGLNVTWVEADEHLTLGEVYNLILEHAKAPIIAKIDDDDFYGEYYLLDSASQLRQSGADLTGKDAIFVYREDNDSTYIRMPHKHHRFVYSVAGATIMTYTKHAEALGFSAKGIGEDQDFLQRAFDAGLKLYSSSPFGFAVYRGAKNTWGVEESFFSNHASIVHTGVPGELECVNSSESATDV